MAATVLTAYHRLEPSLFRAYVYPVSESIRKYQFGRLDPDAKPLLTPFMNPLVAECYAPDKSRGNDEAAVKGRVLDVQSDATLSAFSYKVAVDFVERLVP